MRTALPTKGNTTIGRVSPMDTAANHDATALTLLRVALPHRAVIILGIDPTIEIGR